MGPARVDVVIVNWNAGRLLEDCVRSVGEQGNVVVVDNASTDGSAKAVSSLAEVVFNEENVGFAAGCNEGARRGHAPFVLFLNPDTRLHAETIPSVLRYFERPRASRVGIVGVPLVDGSGAVTRSCSRFPTAGALVARSFGLDRLFPSLFPPHFLRDWDHRATRPVDQVMGAFFFMRRSVFEELGGFDERFFLYFEDVDLSLRARRAGWQSVFVAAPPCFHEGEGTTRRVKAKRLVHQWQSRLAYARKHFGEPGASLVALATASIEPLLRVVFSLARRDLAGARDTTVALLDFWRREAH